MEKKRKEAQKSINKLCSKVLQAFKPAEQCRGFPSLRNAVRKNMGKIKKMLA